MEHKIQEDKIEIDMKNRATEIVMEQDRKDIEQEKQRQIDRAKLLLHFTIKNKEVRKSYFRNEIYYFICFILVNGKQMGI